MQVSGGSRCSEERPCASGSTSGLLPLCVRTNRHRHLFAGMFGCNRSAPYCGPLLTVSHLVNTDIYLLASLCVGVYSRFCVEGPRPCVSPIARSQFSLSLHPRLLFGSRPRWSRLVSPRSRVLTRQRDCSSNACQLSHRGIALFIVNIVRLCVALFHEPCLVPIDSVVGIVLYSEYPPASNCLLVV